MKSYTDIKQSKKLLEFLPLESADMEYMFLKEDNSKVSNIPFIKDDDEPEWPTDSDYDFIPCWSLSALMDVLPYPSIHKHADETWWCDAWVDKVNPYSLRHFKTPVDAYVTMIERLHELKML